MVAADALVLNTHQAISNHHAVNTDSSRDFIGNLSVKITLWNDIFTLKQGMVETQINLPIYVNISLIHNVFQIIKTLIFRKLPLKIPVLGIPENIYVLFDML